MNSLSLVILKKPIIPNAYTLVGRYCNSNYTEYPSRVISFLWHCLKTRNVCVTCRPSGETSWLFNCVYLVLFLCFILALIVITGTDHCQPCVVLCQMDGLYSCCGIKNLLYTTYSYIFYYYNKCGNKDLHLNVFNCCSLFCQRFFLEFLSILVYGEGYFPDFGSIGHM